MYDLRIPEYQLTDRKGLAHLYMVPSSRLPDPLRHISRELGMVPRVDAGHDGLWNAGRHKFGILLLRGFSHCMVKLSPFKIALLPGGFCQENVLKWSLLTFGILGASLVHISCLTVLPTEKASL